MPLMKIRTPSETAEVDYSLTKLLNTPGGLEKLAQEKLPPFIRTIRDYEAFARKVLFCHSVTEQECQILNGEPFVYYPKDFSAEAAFYADDGEVPSRLIEGDGVNVSLMTVASDDAVINLKRLLVQRYNYLERIRELSGQAIGMTEDLKLIALVEALLNGVTSQNVTSSATNLQKVDLISLRQTIAQNDVPCAAYVMHPKRAEDILRWSNADIDELTRRELITSGVRYALWGDTKIITSRAMDIHTVYAFAEPEYVGRMPILQELSAKLTETPNKIERGLFLFEFIGMYLANSLAVGKLYMANAA